MSVETLSVVLHHSKSTGTDKLVLIGIANHAGDGGAWPTIATLAKYANTTDRTVQRSIARLVQAGELTVHVQAGGDHRIKDTQRPNRYDVVLACPATCDRTASHRVRPLPQSQSELWITGVTPTSPGDAHVTGGVTPTSPGGVTPTSPKPSIEPSIEPVALVPTKPQTARATCSVCSLPEAECQRRAAVSGHDFTPAVAS